MDLFSWDFTDNPFRGVQEGLKELQHQYSRLEHIARGASQTLDNCGPGDIVRERTGMSSRKLLPWLKS